MTHHNRASCNHLTDDDLLRVVLARARVDLRAFLKLTFRMLEPNTQLKWNWHLDYLCYLLQQTLPETHPAHIPYYNTQLHPLKNLIINVPPRSLKTILISVAYPAFLLGHNPSHKFITASYSTKASANINTLLARVLKHPLYHQIFPAPHTPILDKATEGFVTTTKGGQCLATSPQGTVTSFGADTLLIDDLLSPEQAFSPSELNRSNRFFFNTLFPSRLNDKTSGVTIVIAQRLTEGDLTGELLLQNANKEPSEQFTHVPLPAIFTEEQTFHFYNQSHTVHPDDLLQPKRDTLASLNAIKADPDVGPYTFAAQYQQNPAPSDGGIININQFLTYNPASLPSPSQTIRITQSWDTAIKTTSRSDYSVCSTWLETPTHHYLIDLVLRKMEYPDLYNFAINNANLHSPTAILIEDKASGQQLIQDLRRNTSLPVTAISPPPQQNKITRAATSIPAYLESGSLLLPDNWESLPYAKDLINQLTYFPNGRHDDIVDSFSQYLNFVKSSHNSTPRIRVL